jgi:hypothetical protein
MDSRGSFSQGNERAGSWTRAMIAYLSDGRKCARKRQPAHHNERTLAVWTRNLRAEAQIRLRRYPEFSSDRSGVTITALSSANSFDRYELLHEPQSKQSVHCLSAATATEEMERDHNHGNDQEDVNQAPDGFFQKKKSQQPQDQQHDTDRQEHFVSPD